MPRRSKSRTSDILEKSSPISDTQILPEILKAARLSRQLSQAQLAGKLGLRQRQISDLERATTDPRLSTIRNVARALELELMLIPRPLISAVEALQRSGSDAGNRPLYALGDDDALTDADEPPQREVGDSDDSSGRPDRPSPLPKRRWR